MADLRPEIDGLIQWRHRLHRYPELSGDEEWTAAEVRKRLIALRPDQIVTGLGGHGVLAQFTGTNPNRRILFRCELDGLPITETNYFDHRSTNQGRGHLCGHDGHMAILMGLAQRLSRQRMNGADVILLFQPAEETGAGARAVIEDAKFAPFKPDYAVSLHNMPGVSLGTVQVKDGAFACASRGMAIRLFGRTAHASSPETGVSPAGVMMKIMRSLPQLQSDMLVEGLPKTRITLTHAKLGEPTFGVSAGDADIFATLRTVTDDDMAALIKQSESLVEDAIQNTDLTANIEYHDIFSASHNASQVVNAIRTAAKQVIGGAMDQVFPMRFSEDFGEFGKVCPSTMFILGAGDIAALHSPDYDFPDELIPVGIEMFVETLCQLVEAN